MAEASDITILFVGSRQSNGAALKRALAKVSGFNIVGEADDAISAVCKARELKPQVVILHAGLSESNSFVIMRRLRGELPDTGIILMASEDSGIDIIAAINAGVNAYCSKHAQRAQLEMAVRTAASGGVWLDQNIAGRVLRTAAAGGLSVMSEARRGEIKGKLSDRECQVLRLVVEGMNNQQMAQELSISVETVKTHIRRIIEKLGVHSRTEAAVLAVHEHLTDATSLRRAGQNKKKAVRRIAAEPGQSRNSTSS